VEVFDDDDDVISILGGAGANKLGLTLGDACDTLRGMAVVFDGAAGVSE